jgi:hypothetical protein
VRIEHRNEVRDDVHELCAVFLGASSEDAAQFDAWYATKPRDTLGDYVAARYQPAPTT